MRISKCEDGGVDLIDVDCSYDNGEYILYLYITDVDEIATKSRMHDELVEALEMVVDGYSAHDLVDMTGFTEEECQTKIVDILQKAKS